MLMDILCEPKASQRFLHHCVFFHFVNILSNTGFLWIVFSSTNTFLIGVLALCCQLSVGLVKASNASVNRAQGSSHQGALWILHPNESAAGETEERRQKKEADASGKTEVSPCHIIFIRTPVRWSRINKTLKSALYSSVSSQDLNPRARPPF